MYGQVLNWNLLLLLYVLITSSSETGVRKKDAQPVLTYYAYLRLGLFLCYTAPQEVKTVQ